MRSVRLSLLITANPVLIYCIQRDKKAVSDWVPFLAALDAQSTEALFNNLEPVFLFFSAVPWS